MKDKFENRDLVDTTSLFDRDLTESKLSTPELKANPAELVDDKYYSPFLEKSPYAPEHFETPEEYRDSFNVHVGTVVRIRPSKRDKRPIAYTELGKIILFKNWKDLHYGFGEITSVKDCGKYFLCTAENCVCDFYTGITEKEIIPLEEFEQVLSGFGFRKQYVEDIDEFDKLYVWAHLKRKILIKFETWSKDYSQDYKNPIKSYLRYNSVNVTLIADPDVRIDLRRDGSGWVAACGQHIEFDLERNSYDFPLHWIITLSTGVTDWGDRTPSLWNYNEHDIRDFSIPLSKMRKFKDNVAEAFGIDLEESIKHYHEIAVELHGTGVF